MELRKFVACTACAAALVAAAGCAEGTGQALTPTLPTTESTTNADGTKLKASAPQPSAPRASVRVSNLTPQLSIVNAAPNESNTGATLSYQFEISEGSTLIVQSPMVSASTDTSTLWTVPANTLKLNKTYSWRARAFYGDVDGSWSEVATFRTPLPPPVDGPVSCASSAGAEIVKCVGRAYPAYLVATEQGSNSLERRKANMAFIRDRIIETGLCKGLNLGRNFKRGGPEISFDFIVWRSDRDRGVDLATGYDELKLPIRLKWQVFGADENYGYPYYSKYPAVDCSFIDQ
jgi:hypothetical protein